MGKAQRKRKLNKINRLAFQQRKTQKQEHQNQISTLRSKFLGLNPQAIISTKHPLENKPFMKHLLNPLQRAMVFCMNFCGGYASDDELEAFCSIYWKNIEAASERRMGYAGLPTKRIFKIIFSIKKNGFPLFVNCPTDPTKHGPYIPQILFQERLLSILKNQISSIEPINDAVTVSSKVNSIALMPSLSGELCNCIEKPKLLFPPLNQKSKSQIAGMTLQELAKEAEPFANEVGYFADLKVCERRVRAILLLYKHKNIVLFDENTEKFFLNEDYLKPGITTKSENLQIPPFLSDLSLKSLNTSQLYDEIKRRQVNSLKKKAESRKDDAE